MSEADLLPIRFVARQLRVPLRWLRAECEAGRIPHLDAGGAILANPDAVKRELLSRAAASRSNEKAVQHA